MQETNSTAGTSTRIPVYDALARDIKSRGIDTVFGLMSDDTALFVTTLDSMGVRFYGARHENTAVAMAEGYAAATGEMGIAIIGRGPATANAIHGAVYAHRTGSRVLLIYGASSVGAGGGPDAKEFNALGVLHAAGLKTLVAANAEGARRMLDNAIDATRGGGCMSLLLPMNVQLGLDDYPGTMPPPGPEIRPEFKRRQARPVAVQAAAALLQRSSRPLFIVGLGAHRSGAREAIERLADKVGAIVATSLKGKDMFHSYAYNVGVVGSFSHAAGRRLIDQADCIVVFGASMNQRTTSYGTSLPLDVPLVHVDLAPSQIGRLFHADVALIADARSAAQQLDCAVPERSAADKTFHNADNRRMLAEHDLASEFQSAATPRTMDPRELAIELDRLLPADRNAVYDAGNFLQVIPYISGQSPDHIKNTVDFASIGMGFGVALGFACGTPQRTTVLFIGDGGFLMTMGELETGIREDLPLVIVLINDCAYGAELHFLKMRGMPVSKSVFADIDFAPVAESFGFQAHTVRSLEELRQLAPLLQKPDGPILLDCKINASVAAGYHTETFEYERARH